MSCATRFSADFQPLEAEALGATGLESERQDPPALSMAAREPAAESPIPSSASPAPARQKKTDTPKSLAEKLLQGWTLTDRYCPVQGCLTPLVRNREKQLMCVECDKWVVPENELHGDSSPAAEAQAPRQQNRPAAQTPTAPATAPPQAALFAESRQPASGGHGLDICTRAIEVLLSKVDLCVSRMEGVQQVPGREASEMVEFLSSASKTILAMNDVRDCLEASRK